MSAFAEGILILSAAIASSQGNGNSDSDTGIQLQNPFKIELAKDIASMAIESNLGSPCKTSVLVATDECENYVSFVTISLSQWGSSVLIMKFPSDPETFIKFPIRKRHEWKNVLSRFHHPCKLIFICALVQTRNSMQELFFEQQQDDTINNLEGFMTLPKIFGNTDQILFLSNYEQVMDEKSPLVEFLKQSEDKVLNQSGVLLSVKLQNEAENAESLFKVYSRCKYCGKQIENQSLGAWQRNRTLFSNFFKTFEDHKIVRFEDYDGFTIGYFDHPPHISCYTITEEIGGINNCSGVEWEMLQQMSKSLKFRLTLRNFTDRGQQGVIYSSNNITGLIGAVNSFELDAAVGAISVTPDKLPYMDITDIFTHQPIGIWLAFEPEVWPLIIFTIGSVAVIIELILRCKGHGKLERKASTVKGLEISVKSLLGQPLTPSQSPRRARPIFKLVLSLWWFTCLIISTVYNTNLIPSLINPVSPKEPESLKNLLDSEYNFRVVSTKSAVPDILQKGGDDDDEYNYPFRQITSRLIPHDDDYYYPTSRVAYVVEESAVRVVNWKEQHEFANIKVINERLFLTGYGWPLRKDAPYKDKFNNAIAHLSAAGLIDHWYEKFTHKEKRPLEARYRLQEKIGQVKLDMEVLQGAFIFLIIGCFTALLTFSYEQFRSRYTFRFFTLKEICGYWKIFVRKVQELDFEREVTRVGHTGVIVIAPFECAPQLPPRFVTSRQQTRHEMSADKQVYGHYLK